LFALLAGAGTALSPCVLPVLPAVLSAGVTGGQSEPVIQAAPPGVRDQLASVATSSFVDALNHITVIAMVVAFVCAAVCFATIRQQDFVQQGPPAAGN